MGMFLVRLLGGVEIEKDGVSRPYGARKYATLLALLALNPQRVFSRSELVAAVWPDSDEEGGRGALRTALSMLRQELSAETFLTTRETVSLNAGELTTDVALLEQGIRQINQAVTVADAAAILQRLQELNRGPLLPGKYDDWIITERSRIDEMMRLAQTRYEILHRTLEKEWPPERPAAPPRPKLPAFGTRFLGRDQETTAVCTLLEEPSVRLVTVTGTGGIGKTRLSVEVAHRLLDDFSNAVYFIPLAACADAEEILTEVGRAVLLESSRPDDGEAAIARRLGSHEKVLIVLDNMEQLVGQGASNIVRRLLEMSPSISVLVTSRQVLGLSGEHVFPLHGLKHTADERLFVEHAQCLQPEFEITETNRSSVQQLCSELEGIPLAIELCAAWIPVLTPQQILVKMEHRFSLLKSRRQDSFDRHRSLHAALEWGCPTDPELLSFFLSLSAFRGGFTLEAAEAVAGADALDRLATLREQSLIVAEVQDNGEMRYRLLETIREFADEKLTSDARVALQRRHQNYYHEVARSVTPRLSGTDTAGDFAALERENPNFRFAIEHGLDDTVESILRSREMIVWLGWFWRMRGHQMPLRAWLEKTYARANELPPIHRAWVLIDYAQFHPSEAATALCMEALKLFEANAVQHGVSQAYESLGRICRRNGDLDGVVDYYHKAAAIRAASGDVRGEGYVLADLAGMYSQFGDGKNARILWRKCRIIAESLGDIGSLAVLDRAEAVSLVAEARLAEALPLLERAAATFRQKGETLNLMDTLNHYANALADSGDKMRAAEVLEEAYRQAENWGDRDSAAEIRKKIIGWMAG